MDGMAYLLESNPNLYLWVRAYGEADKVVDSLVRAIDEPLSRPLGVGDISKCWTL